MLRSTLFAICVTALAVVSAQGQEDGQVYLVKNILTGKVIAPAMDGSGLVQNDMKPRVKFQQWKLVKGKMDNVFQLVNVGSGKVITSPSKESAAQLIFEEAAAKHKPSQWFVVEKMPRGLLIKSQSSGHYLDVEGADSANKTAIIQYTLNEKQVRGNQLWELVPAK